MAHLVRVRLFVRQFPVSLELLERLADVAEEAAQSAGRENFDVPVEVNLNLGEGSLKVASLVLGAIFSTYYFVGNYKAFKEGIVEICDDANKYGNQFCDKFLDAAGISKRHVTRQSIELQTPGKLRNVLNELEQLDQELKSRSLPPDSIAHLLPHAASRLDDVFHDLNDADRTAVIGSLKFEALPPYTQWPRDEQVMLEAPRVGRVPETKQIEDKHRPEPKPVRKRRISVRRKVLVRPRRHG